MRKPRKPICTASAAVALALPPGTPSWITPELVQATLRVWQPHYPAPLSIEDAVAILRGVDRLLRLMPSERRP